MPLNSDPNLQNDPNLQKKKRKNQRGTDDVNWLPYLYQV